MKSALYRCFNTNLKRFLMDSGFRYELIALDVVSQDKMWVFLNTVELENKIKEWENKSPRLKK